MKRDFIKPRGYVRVRVYDKGNLVSEQEGHNLVVSGGRDALAKLIGGDGGTDKVVNQCAFGTSNTAPADGNTALTGELKKAIDNVTYPVTGTAQFEFVCEESEFNGNTINEIGLYTDDDTLFARKVIDPIIKTNTVRVEFFWQIIF